MKTLNNYITEAWSGVKTQSLKSNIEDWCEEMGIEDYTINDKEEIDVDGDVRLNKKDFKELPYKFGRVNGFFSLGECKNLTSLKNCPYFVGDSFMCDNCINLDLLEGCPKEVGSNFWCGNCKGKFTEKEVKHLCKVKKIIFI